MEFTALHMTARQGQTEMAKLLCKYGGSPFPIFATLTQKVQKAVVF
jgi:ankyrin repeat protein